MSHGRLTQKLRCLLVLSALLVAPASAQEAEPAAPRGVETATLVTSVSPLVGGDTPLCVCGEFADRSALTGLSIDGTSPLDVIEIQPPAAGKPGRAHLGWPPDLPPGRHVLTGGGLPLPFEVIEIEGTLDRKRLLAGESVPLTLVVEGTGRPVEIALTNSSPAVIRIEGGDEQLVRSSGGEHNHVSRTVRALERGPFVIDFQALGLGECPCETEATAQNEAATAERGTGPGPPEPRPPFAPPAEADGPCEWLTLRFEALASQFPLPDLELLCDLARSCVEADRLAREAADAVAGEEAARQELESLRQRAERFDEFLSSDAAAHNRGVDPSLPAHWADVQRRYAGELAAAEIAFLNAESRAVEAGAHAELSRAACQEARAVIDLQLVQFEGLLGAWEAFRVELARCESCEALEGFVRSLEQMLDRLRAARDACLAAHLDPEREAAQSAAVEAAAAEDDARAEAEELSAVDERCAALEREVLAEYQECFSRALVGTDHVTGDRRRGYGHRRTIRTGVRDAELGPVWFDSSREASRFRRTMDDCLRQRQDGRTTRPNTLTRRRDARRCESSQRSQSRRAGRARERADQAAEANRAVRAALGQAERTIEEPFDRLETILAGWADLAREAGEDCAFRRERCEQVRRAGEAAPAPPCSPQTVADSADRARSSADDVRRRMSRLALAGCPGGWSALAEAERALDGLAADDGPLARARSALDEREQALAKARESLAERRCERAEAAYRRAARAGQRTAKACEEARRLLGQAETATERAASLLAGCEQREQQLAAAERRQRERERQQAEARRAAAARARARAQERTRAVEEARRRAAEPPRPAPAPSNSCASQFVRWVEENLPEDQRDETLDTLRELAQNAAEAASEGVASAAEAAASGARPAGIGASGAAAGIFSLGSSLFYMWMQSELTEGAVRLGNWYDTRLLQARLAGQRGHCGQLRSQGVTYFWVRVGGEFRAFKISHSRGLEFIGAVRSY